MTPFCLHGDVIIFRGVSRANPPLRRGPDQPNETPPLAPADVCNTSQVFRDSSALNFHAGLFKTHVSGLEMLGGGELPRLVTDGDITQAPLGSG